MILDFAVSPYKRETGGSGSEGDGATEAEGRAMHFEDGGRGHKARNLGETSRSQKRHGNRFPLELPEATP